MSELRDILQVVLITYNRRRTFERTLGRIFAPDSPIAACDIIVLDNCSTDGTRELLAATAAQHPNLSVITHRRNIGGNANIVRAFELAERKYVWVLCDDDDFDWNQWGSVGRVLAAEEHDLIFTVRGLARVLDKPNEGYLAYLAAFVPGCIYRTQYITGDVLQNMYGMIHTWYPQCVLSLHILCNLHGRVFLPDTNVVIRGLETADGARTMTIEENDSTLVRGISEKLLHPDLKRMFWHVGFAEAAQIVTDEAQRNLVIEQARFNEVWEGDFMHYCEYVVEYNREYRGGSLKNLLGFLLNLPRSRRFSFVMLLLHPYLPFYAEAYDGRVELVLFWRIKLRIWDRRWFGGKQRLKRVFITGGTGFFGKSLLDHRRRHPGIAGMEEWTILSRDPGRFLADNPSFVGLPNVVYVRGDVRDFDVSGEYDLILHAATPAVTTLADEEMTSIIVDGTRHVIDFARAHGRPRIVFTSSGAVYGPATAPLAETAECHPETAYGKAKLAAERLLLESGLDVRIARCFAFVGPYLNRRIHYAIGNFIQDCLDGRDIVIRGDGTPQRSYLYADDLVEWLRTITERGIPSRVYNVGSGEAMSIRAVAEGVKAALGGGDIHVLGTPVPGAVPSVYVPDVARARTELGLVPHVGFAEAVRLSAGQRGTT